MDNYYIVKKVLKPDGTIFVAMPFFSSGEFKNIYNIMALAVTETGFKIKRCDRTPYYLKSRLAPFLFPIVFNTLPAMFHPLPTAFHHPLPSPNPTAFKAFVMPAPFFKSREIEHRQELKRGRAS